MSDGARGVGDRVDMLAQAREAQWSAQTFLGADPIKLVAPAKVNLFLGVGARREDGYHDVTTVMHALSLHDVMYMALSTDENASSVAPSSGRSVSSPSSEAQVDSSGDDISHAGPAKSIAVSIDVADKTDADLADIDVADNLVFKAIDALACAIGRTERERISVRVEKHIPAEAGLGGGSADAAAALVGAAHLWGVSDRTETIEEVASSLGADVAFFLRGGCGLLTGAGERFERGLEPMKLPVVLVKPDAGVSTAKAYAAFDESPVGVSDALIAKVNGASCAEDVPLFNNLTAAACEELPVLAEIAAWLGDQQGVVDAACGHGVGSEAGASPKATLLCGSGAATFAIAQSYSDALRIAASASARGWWARATTLSPLRATMV